MAKDKFGTLDIGLEMAFQASALGVATMLSVTAFAPVLPQDMKQKINQTIGGDLDMAHHTLRSQLMVVAEYIEGTVSSFQNGGQNGGQEAQPRTRKSAANNKCEGQRVEIGKWVFTIPTPNCL